MRTVHFTSPSHVADLCGELLDEHGAAAAVQVRMLRNRRWRQLWTHNPAEPEATAKAIADALDDWSTCHLWITEGSNTKAKVELVPAAAAELAAELDDGEELARPAPVTWQPSEPITDGTNGLFELWRSEVDRLRRENQDLQRLVLQLVAELMQAGRGSQGQLLKLIAAQTGMLTDAWRAAGEDQARERRRLDRLRRDAEADVETASAAVNAAEEAAADAEQTNAVVGALVEHLGPQLLDSLKGGGA